jgi:chromosome segregation ATPase
MDNINDLRNKMRPGLAMFEAVKATSEILEHLAQNEGYLTELAQAVEQKQKQDADLDKALAEKQALVDANADKAEAALTNAHKEIRDLKDQNLKNLAAEKKAHEEQLKMMEDRKAELTKDLEDLKLDIADAKKDYAEVKKAVDDQKASVIKALDKIKG